jgi:hypothetical protein
MKFFQFLTRQFRYFFSSEKEKKIAELEFDLETICKVFEIIIRRKSNFERKLFIDFDFELLEREKLIIFGYLKYGVLDIFTDDTKNLIVKVVNSDAGDISYEDDLNELNNRLFILKWSQEKEIQELKSN